MLNKKEEIQVCVLSHETGEPRQETILGYTYKGLSLHISYGTNPKQSNWSITHIDSGQEMFTFHNFKIIRDFTKGLADTIDCTVSVDELDKSAIVDYIDNNFKYQRF